MELKLSKNKLYAMFIFLFTFIIYLMTLAPSITSEDSGDFINCAHKLVIAHPPGYPLYCITGKIFTFLPIKTIAYRVNLMSAIFASLAAVFVFLIIQKLLNNEIVALTASLIFAFSNSLWSQAVIAEVYTMNLFFFALLFYLALLYKETSNKKTLFLFIFVYGLSLGNHVMLLFFAPVFLFLLRKKIKEIVDKKVLITCLLFFLLGVSIYLFIPLAIIKTKGSPTQLPYYDPAKPLYANVYDVITAEIYRAQTDFQIKPVTILYRTKSLFLQFFHEISLLMLFSLVGLFYLIKKDKELLLLLLLIIIIDLLYTIFINIYPMYITKFGMIALFALMVLIGYGFFYILSFIPLKKLTYGITIVAIIPLLMNFQGNNQHANWLTYNYGKDILTAVPEHSFLYIISDDAYFPLNFHLTIETENRKKLSAFYEGALIDEKITLAYIQRFLENEKNYNGLFYIPDFRNLEIQYYDGINNPFVSYYQQESYFRQYGILYLFSGQDFGNKSFNPWNTYNNTGFEDEKVPKNYLDAVRIIYYYQMLMNQFQDKAILEEFAKKQILHINHAIDLVEQGFSGYVNEERVLLMLNFLMANDYFILDDDMQAQLQIKKLEDWRFTNKELEDFRDLLVENLRRHS